MIRWTNELVEKNLTRLGSSVEEIRASLVKQGVKGVSSGGSCPVANYLKNLCGCDDVIVYADAIFVDWGVQFAPSKVMANFIRAFDAGEFPELVAE